MAGQMVYIDDSNYQQHINPVVDGHLRICNCNPRDFITRPHGTMYGIPKFSIPTIDKSQWATLLAQQIANKAQLTDVRNIMGPNGSPIPSRDQDGVGYCWCHSGTSAHLLASAMQGEPYADLSAFSVGCMIKNYRDEGGEGIDGVQFQGQRGVATSQFWPQQSMNRSNDNPATWADAAKRKYVVWQELDPNQMEEQLVTCMLLNIPVVVDYNWWSHSVCAIRIVELFKTGEIWNSWGNGWSANGVGQLSWNKFIPDAAVAAIDVMPVAA